MVCIKCRKLLKIDSCECARIDLGTQNSIRSQRYNDSVQNFANFWRDIYASVSNTQGSQGNSGGRSDYAYYGKLVVFGHQNYNISGDDTSKDTSQKIYYYDVIGDVPSPSDNLGNTLLDALKAVNANVIYVNQEDFDEGTIEFSGSVDRYTPTWGAIIESPEVTGADNTQPFIGSILVVKHPRSTAINTYFSEDIIAVNDKVYTNKNQIKGDEKSFLANQLYDSEGAPRFKSDKSIDFCINSDDIGLSWFRRQDVRIVANANNTSGVEIIGAGSDNNPCTNPSGAGS